MPEAQNKVSFKDVTGARNEVAISIEDYREAADKSISLTQLFATKYPSAANESTLEQFAASAGLRLKHDPLTGIPASNMKDIMHGTLDKTAGGTVIPTRGTGTDRQTTAGRLLFPEIMMQLIHAQLYADKEDVLGPWESAIALRTSVTGPRVDQPTVNIQGAMDGGAAQPIGQLAEPAIMLGITLDGRQYVIPTKAIGVQIADQAMESTTIDFLALMISAQARGERIRRIEADMVNIISGDTDLGINAVTFANASTFATAGTGKITHRQWVKWLRANYQKLNISHVLTSIDSALDIEGREGKPAVVGDLSTAANRIPADFSIENIGITPPKVLLLPSAVIGADRAVGFDKRFALHEITNISASYSAIENFVMRRSTSMRFDYGSALVKLYDEAFAGLTLGA